MKIHIGILQFLWKTTTKLNLLTFPVVFYIFMLLKIYKIFDLK